MLTTGLIQGISPIDLRDEEVQKRLILAISGF